MGPSGVEAGAGWRWGLGRSGWAQAHATNLEVFLEAVGLEQVGEFEGTHVTALSVDFALEISDDGAQVLEGVTGHSSSSHIRSRSKARRKVWPVR